MGDRTLSVPDFIKLYRAHGCEADINRNSFVIVVWRQGAEYRRFSQHAHKGLRDKFGPFVVRRSRRHLGFDSMPDDRFYAPLD